MFRGLPPMLLRQRRRRRLAPGLALVALVSPGRLAGSRIGWSEDWPQHLGPRRDGSSAEPAPQAWPAVGPPVVWRRPIGQSYAAPVVAGDQVFVFHRVGDEARLDCLRAADGKSVWTYRGADPLPRRLRLHRRTARDAGR